MTKATWVTLAFLCVSVMANVMLAYLWIDRSLTLSYVSQSADSSADALQNLMRVLETEWRGLPESDVLQKLQKTLSQSPKADLYIKKDEGIIWFGNVPFYLEQGALKHIGGQ
ncbi:hypothetical protein ELE36_17280 [Pseudolysobacter antarcticus]|uniref:Two-component sensor histidine kinase n=1 Tax=Pseudolysobacter antarcticus TaxID=2511995 RepID=A0A411HNC5_9GAMM|nr:Imm58 family immunity protein [Pseudolysobacter antarcticus]QBB71974.1 hypothetical protein ELE36_17280 [Pseudolysobacter antarcticus]